MQTAGGATLNEPPAVPGEPLPAPVAADPVSPVGAAAVTNVKSAHQRTYATSALALLASTGLGVLVLDQVAKHLAVAQLSGEPPVRLLGGAVYLVLTRNSGAAFSIARDYTVVFSVIALLVAGWIVWTARRLRSLPWAASLGLIFGGAVGNLIDRIFRAPRPFFGHVVDFISLFDDRGRVWPVFNIADAALVCGVVLAILLDLTGRRRDGTRVARRESR